MALEQLIIAWISSRPAWQQEVMRRIAAGERFSDEDHDELTESVLAGKPFPEPLLRLEHFPQLASKSLPVRLLAIARPEHVNALATQVPLTFEPTGLTIVYGDNASGKSGYARLLKRITRARHQEEVLSDVFRDTTLAKPTATVLVRIGESEISTDWPESKLAELQQVRFYDSACGTAYVSAESDFPYRPSALFVMDGLIEACVAVRSRLDTKLAENDKAARALPSVPADASDSDVGRFLASLSAKDSVETVNALIALQDESAETIDSLKALEASLRAKNATKERQGLIKQSEKLGALVRHLEQLSTVLGADNLATLERQREELKEIKQTATASTHSLASEPLPGTGAAQWKWLWESAERFSKEQAYFGREFPVLDDDCRCVLCQQPLEAEARARLLRFARFVADELQVRLQTARREHEVAIARIASLQVSTDVVVFSLKDLETSHGQLGAQVREFLTLCDIQRTALSDALKSGGVIHAVGVDCSGIVARLREASNAATAAAEGLANPEATEEQLAKLIRRRSELELLDELKKSRETVVWEITRLKERETLEAAKNAASTGPITKKILELSEESITEVVRDTFTRETDRLQLDRVTIARTRPDKGALLHQPKLVGARQDATLPRVFSEGERTALGLAAFFTEAQLDGSKSGLVLDDPVTSLDHIRRELVAARLAAFAQTRQVVVFTHDVAFVADLKRAASENSVAVTERSVARSRADERKPGVCNNTHPWKAKDVPARLNELGVGLARIKRDSGSWDEKTYEDAVSLWAGNLSETWERIFSHEVVGPILAEGGLEVRPQMVKLIARFSDDDHLQFEASYSRASQWAKRHDKSTKVNYVAPVAKALEEELALVEAWFKRVKTYKN